MEKWADYLISAVRYEDDQHIDCVKVRRDLGDKVGKGSVQKRSWVVSKIESGNSFITIFKNEEGKWRKGQDVHIVPVNGKKFIRTDRNKVEADNLGELPKF